jgi:phage terminase large subunit-like protein
LKISKGYSKDVDRRTDNAMAKRKRTSTHTKIIVHKKQLRKLKIEQHESNKNHGLNQGAWEV